jgi:hypothetical protein
MPESSLKPVCYPKTYVAFGTYAGIPPVRFCAGGTEVTRYLPRSSMQSEHVTMKRPYWRLSNEHANF